MNHSSTHLFGEHAELPVDAWRREAVPLGRRHDATAGAARRAAGGGSRERRMAAVPRVRRGWRTPVKGVQVAAGQRQRLQSLLRDIDGTSNNGDMLVFAESQSACLEASCWKGALAKKSLPAILATAILVLHSPLPAKLYLSPKTPVN